MKSLVAFGEEAAELASGDVDPQFVQLFEQQRLGDVAVVMLVEQVGDEGGAEMLPRQDGGGQGGEQRAAVGQEDAFTQVAGDRAVEDEFLNEVRFVAFGGGARRRVGEGQLDLDGREEGGVLGALGGARAFGAWGGWGGG